jgi:hypothetical protein
VKVGTKIPKGDISAGSSDIGGGGGGGTKTRREKERLVREERKLKK